MFSITKDVHETLDYIFIRPVVDDLIVSGSVVVEQSPNATVTVLSDNVNVSPITDDNGNTYPANSAIILWLSGGVSGVIETIRLQYTTVAGRILDEEISVVCVGVG